MPKNKQLTEFLSAFNTEIVDNSKIDDFKHQVDIQINQKYSLKGDYLKKNLSKAIPDIKKYIINKTNCFNSLFFITYIDTNFDKTLIDFFQADLNLIGIIDNLFIFYSSYLTSTFLTNRRYLINSKSLVDNIKLIRMIMDKIIEFYNDKTCIVKKIKIRSEFLLFSVIDYYIVNKLVYKEEATQQKDEMIINIVFNFFDLEMIWFVLLSYLIEGKAADAIFNLIYLGFKKAKRSRFNELLDMILVRQGSNGELITYNYISEVKNKLLVSGNDTIFGLIVRFLSRMEITWQTENKARLDEFFNMIIESNDLRILDSVFHILNHSITAVTDGSAFTDKIKMKSLLFTLNTISNLISYPQIKSYLLDKKFTLKLLELEKLTISAMTEETTLNDFQLSVLRLVWSILPVLCNPLVGIRNMISDKEDEKMYIEDMPIEIRISEILNLIISDGLYNQIEEESYRELIIMKLRTLKYILNNSQGKNVFLQLIISKKIPKVLLDSLSNPAVSFEIVSELIDIVLNFRDVKDFKNVYLLDRLMSKVDSNKMDKLVNSIQSITSSLLTALEVFLTADTSSTQRINVNIKLVQLKDFIDAFTKRTPRLLKKSFKAPKLAFNDEMPQDIEKRFEKMIKMQKHRRINKSMAKQAVLEMNLIDLTFVLKKDKHTRYGERIKRDHQQVQLISDEARLEHKSKANQLPESVWLVESLYKAESANQDKDKELRKKSGTVETYKEETPKEKPIDITTPPIMKNITKPEILPIPTKKPMEKPNSLPKTNLPIIHTNPAPTTFVNTILPKNPPQNTYNKFGYLSNNIRSSNTNIRAPIPSLNQMQPNPHPHPMPYNTHNFQTYQYPVPRINNTMGHVNNLVKRGGNEFHNGDRYVNMNYSRGGNYAPYRYEQEQYKRHKPVYINKPRESFEDIQGYQFSDDESHKKQPEREEKLVNKEDEQLNNTDEFLKRLTKKNK